jgi:glycosyltransferase involved in cell wall biosynthesis
VVRSAIGTLVFAALLSLARWRGIRILWTVHDLGSNDDFHPRLEAWFWRFFVKRIDAYICLSEGSRRLARERFPELRRLPSFTTPHGHYGDAYPRQASRAEARRMLELPADATVLLHFGLIRPYKNVPHLIRTFRELQDAKSILVVAGNPYDETVERELQAAAEGASGVRLRLGWVTPEEVPLLFGACDLVVLPYRRILNSGVTMLALSLERPILVADRGAMREQQAKFGPEWLRLYDGELERRHLEEACRWAKATPRRSPDFTGLDWDTLAIKTRAIYQSLVAVEAAERWSGRAGGAEPTDDHVRQDWVQTPLKPRESDRG